MKQATILVIEDNLTLFRLIKTVLTTSSEQSRYQYQIVYAPDGISGIEQVWLASPDIILLDIELPELDGYEVLQWLRSLEITVPVIVMTANKEKSARHRAFEAGCNAYITKPFHPSYLRSCLQELLTSESGAGENNGATWGIAKSRHPLLKHTNDSSHRKKLPVSLSGWLKHMDEATSLATHRKEWRNQ
ncbi:MAG TPA: response regulator [Ktedonobacteraceae bacterium]